MNQIVDNYVKSFNVRDEGFSRKKILASIVIVVTMGIEIHWATHCSFGELIGVLTANFAFIFSALGLSTYQAVNKSNNENPTKTTTTVISKDIPTITQTSKESQD